MKGKIILYGWIFSLLPMIGGLGTMEWAMETGEPVMLLGLGLFIIWVVFSVLLIRNQKIVDKEADRFNDWFDRTIIRNGKDKQSR